MHKPTEVQLKRKTEECPQKAARAAKPPDPSVIKAAFAALKAKRDADEFTARQARVAAPRLAGAAL